MAQIHKSSKRLLYVLSSYSQDPFIRSSSLGISIESEHAEICIVNSATMNSKKRQASQCGDTFTPQPHPTTSPRPPPQETLQHTDATFCLKIEPFNCKRTQSVPCPNLQNHNNVMGLSLSRWNHKATTAPVSLWICLENIQATYLHVRQNPQYEDSERNTHTQRSRRKSYLLKEVQREEPSFFFSFLLGNFLAVPRQRQLSKVLHQCQPLQLIIKSVSVWNCLPASITSASSL